MGEDPSQARRVPFWPTLAMARAGATSRLTGDPRHAAEGPSASPARAVEPHASRHSIPSAELVIAQSEINNAVPLIATAELTPSHQDARSKNGISPQRPCFTVSCDDWTFHTLEFFFSGRQPVDVLREIKASPLHPEVHSRRFRDPLSGRPFIRGYSVIAHFSSPESTRLRSHGCFPAGLPLAPRPAPQCITARPGIRSSGERAARAGLRSHRRGEPRPFPEDRQIP